MSNKSGEEWGGCATCGDVHDEESRCPMAIAERESIQTLDDEFGPGCDPWAAGPVADERRVKYARSW
jgi:hypothetical protein